MTINRPIVVGEAPRFNDQAAAFLEDVAGLPRGVLAPWFKVVNLLCRSGGRVAQQRAKEIVAKARAEGRPIIVSGRRAAQSFGVAEPSYMTWTNVDSAVRLAVIPHPSTNNRWWNEPPNRTRFAAFVAPLVKGNG